MQTAGVVSTITRNYQQIRQISSSTCAITKIHRKTYARQYPTLVVLPDGSSITVRYPEPREIIRVSFESSVSGPRASIFPIFQLPLDLTTLTEAERRKRLEMRKPRSRLIVQEEIEDNYDSKKYLKFVKKWMKTAELVFKYKRMLVEINRVVSIQQRTRFSITWNERDNSESIDGAGTLFGSLVLCSDVQEENQHWRACKGN